jgi:glycosyltransferase involved in cell wall biosynthesis
MDAQRRQVAQLGICIPTYKRPHLLKKLLHDLARQTMHPNVLVIVDGDPSSGEVEQMLKSQTFPASWKIVYVPSNHGNVAYQRYLGWRMVLQHACIVLLYLDDDLRVQQCEAVQRVVDPIQWPGQNIVGVTAHIDAGWNVSSQEEALSYRHHVRPSRIQSFLVSLLGASRHTPPGGLSSSGYRRRRVYRGYAYETVQWHHGGVMAYKVEALPSLWFVDDLFALFHIGCSTGEDTFMSHRASFKGHMLMAFNATFEHPDEDLPKAYPIKALHFGYATAYSRRFLNDHYRGLYPPHFTDRVALVKSYIGTAALHWLSVLATRNRSRLAYAWGYTRGALRGLIQKPTARALTPHINWWQDAKDALAVSRIIQENKQ